MADRDDTLPPGQVRFFDSYQPGGGLTDGGYTITVRHTVAAGNASVPDAVQRFVVAGPRFVLPPADIHAQFPPAGATSQFAEVLPHIVFNKRLLPWERDIPGLGGGVPWLALLVFAEGELLGGDGDTDATIANYARTMTVADLLTAASDTRVPQLDRATVSSDEQSQKCQAIEIAASTFAAIVPTARELPYLAHAREVDTASKVPLDLQNAGLFSVVVANRFPLAGDTVRGSKNIVHLVSLEGFGDLLGGVAPAQPSQARVRLVSLCSWSFSCVPDPAQRFSGLTQNLAYDPGGNPRPATSLALRLPLPDSPPEAGASATYQRLADGYVALGYHAATGEEGFAWFRGPLAPVIAAPLNKPEPFATAAAAVIYDPETGVFDHSLAAAWNCGRSLALADESFATTLMRVRQQAFAQLPRIAPPGAPASAGPGGALHAQLAALFAAGAIDAVRRTSTASIQPAPRTRSERPKVPPVQALRARLALPETRAALARDVAGNPDTAVLAQWLARLQLLYGVPFAHLVPDSRMLPPESLRFFYLDANWLAALCDGALSIGLGSSREVDMQRTVSEQLEQMSGAATKGTNAGLLIRSALIAGWPGIAVSGAAAGTPVPAQRLDRMAPDVLLCLFDGVPDSVTIAEPHEGLAFGVEDKGKIVTRVLTGAQLGDGKAVTVYDPADPAQSLPTIRAGGQRVLNLDGGDGASDLLAAIAEALGCAKTAIGPADFAMQMVKGPEEITFSANPSPKPF